MAMLYIFNGAIQEVHHLGSGIDEESNKIDIEMRSCSQKGDAPHTNSSMYSFL